MNAGWRFILVGAAMSWTVVSPAHAAPVWQDATVRVDACGEVGTGVLVSIRGDKPVLMTAAHVVKGCDVSSIVAVRPRDANILLRGEAWAVDEDHDVALIRLQQNMSRQPHGEWGTPTLRDETALTGWSCIKCEAYRLAQELIHHAKHAAKKLQSFFTGDTYGIRPSIVAIELAKAQIFRGDSGTPLIDSGSQQLVGIVVGYVSPPAGRTVGVGMALGEPPTAFSEGVVQCTLPYGRSTVRLTSNAAPPVLLATDIEEATVAVAALREGSDAHRCAEIVDAFVARNRPDLPDTLSDASLGSGDFATKCKAFYVESALPSIKAERELRARAALEASAAASVVEFEHKVVHATDEGLSALEKERGSSEVVTFGGSDCAVIQGSAASTIFSDACRTPADRISSLESVAREYRWEDLPYDELTRREVAAVLIRQSALFPPTRGPARPGRDHPRAACSGRSGCRR